MKNEEEMAAESGVQAGTGPGTSLGVADTASMPDLDLNNKSRNASIDRDNASDGPSLPVDGTYFPDPNISTPTALETASWWAEFTSVHGVYYALERGHFRPWKRIVWTILVLVAAGGLLWVLVVEFQDFFEYTVNTSTETKIPLNMPFPQVTVCNSNMYDSSLQNITGIQEPRNEEELSLISQPLEEFILYTSFNNAQYQNLTQIWTPVITPFGRCYTFSTDENVIVPGASAGLNVDLWLNQLNYDASTVIAGIYVFVAQKGTPITEQTPRVLVPPGSASFLSMSRFEFKRETDHPWSRCYGSSPEYSNERCRAECIDDATMAKCGCRPIGDARNTTISFCNSSNTACQQSIGDEELDVCESCSIPPCEEEIFYTTYSSARVAIKATVQLEDELGLDPGQFSENFVQVHVNYDLIRYQLITESKATTAAQMVSNLGGNMGFFMGLSMISVVEIFIELLGLRLIPRLFGNTHLYGVGQKKFD